MKEIIVKKIIKDDDPNKRVKYGIFAGIIGLISNTVLVTLKIIFGLITNSISIIADGINNLSDFLGNLVTIIGFKLSNKKADDDHPFGHQRIEYIIGLIISIVIVIIGFNLAKSSIEKIIKPNDINFTYITIIILVISIFIKIYQGLWYKFLGKRINSISLIASSKDSFNDCIATFGVLISVIIFMIFDINIDSYVGLLVSLFIIYSGIKLILEASDPLIGKIPNKEFVDKMLKILLSNNEILGYHDLVIHSYGPDMYYATIHLEFDYKIDVLVIHEIIDDLENKVCDDLGIILTVHMDPVVTDDEETNQLKTITKNILNEIDERLDFHDFRLVKGINNTNVLFDCVVPDDLNKYDIFNKIKEEYNRINKKYTLRVTFDNYFNYKKEN